MVDRIDKALSKLDARELKAVQSVLKKIVKSDLKGLDVKKLKGRVDTFRVRKGSIRIIFMKSDEDARIIAIERRCDTTY